MAKFIIEHLEPKVYEWCLLEYAHMSKQVGKENLIFTNTNSNQLKKFGKVVKESVAKLKLEKACILDPEAPQQLTPENAKFNYYIFGGILGDDPPKERTREMLTSKLPYPAFNLGKRQMSTDTAVIVTKKIIEGQELSKLKFQENLTLHIKEGEEVILPYNYLIEKGKPVLAKGLVTLMKKQSF